jgi:hypothetical protein
MTANKERAHPQIMFRIPECATVEYYPDPETESSVLVFKTKEGRPVLLMPVSVYEEFKKHAK